MLATQKSIQVQPLWGDTAAPDKKQGLPMESRLLTWHRLSERASMPLLWLGLRHCELIWSLRKQELFIEQGERHLVVTGSLAQGRSRAKAP